MPRIIPVLCVLAVLLLVPVWTEQQVRAAAPVSLNGIWKASNRPDVLWVEAPYYTIYQMTGPTTLIRKRGMVDDLRRDASVISRQGADELMITKGGDLVPVRYQLADDDTVRRIKERSVMEPARGTTLTPDLNTMVFLMLLANANRSEESPNLKEQAAAILENLPTASIHGSELFTRLCTALIESGDDLGTMVRPDGALCEAAPASAGTMLSLWKQAGGASGDTSDATSLEALRGAFIAHMNRTMLGGKAVFSARGRIVRGKLDDGSAWLGVLDLEGLSEESGAVTNTQALINALSEALDDLKTAPRLVLDLRFSTGGGLATGLELASRFTDATRVAFLVAPASPQAGLTDAEEIYVTPSLRSSWSAPVAVLISDLTAGAAEAAVLAMHDVPGIILVGDNTRGELAESHDWVLPNNWRGTLSATRFLASDGTAYQRTGIPPAVRTSPGSADTFLDDLVADINLAITQIPALPR
ncbi:MULTISPECIES: S41 family peptidase [unclassified Haematospirillum]|uniref:S41 family peptidase n=1 Tax=unclassified Haematospirillum TaxID=2622088 RepID=UPI00143B5502|nr:MULTISPECIES: S41 family peptidase [unclassified Haematospirillum]NKD54811.1 hypothetical protein [Haematospirillum sp. H4890]NKD74649.1 hypothetical protein [Haematospirillum sp. H4485]